MNLSSKLDRWRLVTISRQQLGLADKLTDRILEIVGKDVDGCDLFLLPAQRQLMFDPRQNLQDLEGLGDVIDAADLERFDLIQHFIERTDENNWNIAGLVDFFQSLTYLKAIHPWHLNVEQDQIGRGPLGDAERNLAVIGRADFVALLSKNSREHVQVGWRVVDNQDVGLRRTRFCHDLLIPSLNEQLELIDQKIIRQPLQFIRQGAVLLADLVDQRLDLIHVGHQDRLP